MPIPFRKNMYLMFSDYKSTYAHYRKFKVQKYKKFKKSALKLCLISIQYLYTYMLERQFLAYTTETILILLVFRIFLLSLHWMI